MADAKPTGKTAMILKRALLSFIGVLAVLAGIVASQPAEFSVVRTTTIAAPPAAAFAHVNDLHQWEAWSPWAKLDPAMKTTYSGTPAGVGAVYAWTGNDQVGEGRMTVTESRPDEHVALKLEFLKPFEATNTADFTFKPEGTQTTVAWSMAGHKNFITKAVCLFMDMDKTLGGQFEKGLAQLKSVVEAAPKK